MAAEQSSALAHQSRKDMNARLNVVDRKIDAMMRRWASPSSNESPPTEEDTTVRDGDETVESAKLGSALHEAVSVRVRVGGCRS